VHLLLSLDDDDFNATLLYTNRFGDWAAFKVDNGSKTPKTLKPTQICSVNETQNFIPSAAGSVWIAGYNGSNKHLDQTTILPEIKKAIALTTLSAFEVAFKTSGAHASIINKSKDFNTFYYPNRRALAVGGISAQKFHKQDAAQLTVKVPVFVSAFCGVSGGLVATFPNQDHTQPAKVIGMFFSVDDWRMNRKIICSFTPLGLESLPKLSKRAATQSIMNRKPLWNHLITRYNGKWFYGGLNLLCSSAYDMGAACG
jgi:hypothetical protein